MGAQRVGAIRQALASIAARAGTPEGELNRAQLLASLAPRFAALGRSRAIFDRLPLVPHPAARTVVLAGLAGSLPAAARAAAAAALLEAARAIPRRQRSIEALAEVIPLLPAESARREAAAEALRRARQARVAPHVAMAVAVALARAGDAGRALEVTRTVPVRVRGECLEYLAPLVPPDTLPAIVAAALALPATEPRRAAAALAVMARAPGPPYTEAALMIVRALPEVPLRARDLARLSAYLPPAARAAARAEARALARDPEGRETAADALLALLPPAESERQGLLSEVVAAIAALDPAAQPMRWEGAAPHLPAPLLAAALRVIGRHPPHARAGSLHALAPFLPPPLLRRALTLAQAVAAWAAGVVATQSASEPFNSRANSARAAAATALYGVGRALREPERMATLQEALALARAIGGVASRAAITTQLAPLLAEPERGDAVADALAAAMAGWRGRPDAGALALLVPLLPDTLLDDVLAAASHVRAAWE